MSKGATKRSRIGRRLQDNTNDSDELYSLVRRLDTPNSISVPSFSGTGGGSNAGSSSGTYLPTAGGVMVGAISFNPRLVSISSGAIDIGTATDNYSSRVIVSPESGSTDDLVTISNAAHAGQLLILQGVQTNTITLKTTGNIETINGSDFALSDDDNIILIYDSTDTKWQQVTTGKTNFGGDNLGNHTATQNLDMDDNDIIGIAGLDLDGVAATIDGVVNLNFYNTSNSINSVSGGLNYQVNSAEYHRFLIGGSEKFWVGTSQIDFVNQELIRIGRIDSDVEIEGSHVIKSYDSTDIGIQVSSNSITVGSQGTMQIPYIANTNSSPADSTVDGWFGNANGCIGIQYEPTGGTHRIWFRSNGGWVKNFGT